MASSEETGADAHEYETSLAPGTERFGRRVGFAVSVLIVGVGAIVTVGRTQEVARTAVALEVNGDQKVVHSGGSHHSKHSSSNGGTTASS